MKFIDSKLTYISLFSSAGVGCYGFKMNGFECIATNEMLSERLAIQKYNNKCKYETGYICGDITLPETHEKLLTEVERWKLQEGLKNVTVLVATPPCQGMSVANHKKADNEIVRNSLVVESIKLVNKIKPYFFVFENVPAFMKTVCTDVDGNEKEIGVAIDNNLGSEYSIYHKIINFKNYGACSSRSRTLVIGVKKELADFVSPFEIFPDFKHEKTLRETIGHLEPLKTFGQICKTDALHFFRKYPEHMRAWIADLREGESAFNQADINKIPHQIIDGKIVINKQKNGDKYRRQIWDKVGPCIHTRNDQLASQNTVHPSDDRVFSIRELMLMMSIPDSFQWTDLSLEELNNLTESEKIAFLKKNEMNIRRCLGEAVPTAILDDIALKIKKFMECNHLKTTEVNAIIEDNNLTNFDALSSFIDEHINDYGVSTLSKIAEYANAKRENNAAFFTDKSIMNEIIKQLPDFEQDTVRILEPSVGTGNFIPFILKKYETIKNLIIDVVDIDSDVIFILKKLIDILEIKSSVIINYVNDDFLLHDFSDRYDLVIGNPPFNRLSKGDSLAKKYLNIFQNKKTTNTFAFFMEKAINLGDYVSLITPKFLLNTPEFKETRNIIEKYKVDCIIDFGEHGFKGVLVETICTFINTTQGSDDKKSRNTVIIKSITEKKTMNQKQSYIFDHTYPYWIIYRDSFFDEIAAKLNFDMFNVFRDRQITNSKLKNQGDIRVVKSRNISDDGTEINDIPGYDSYISTEDAKTLSVYKYLKDDTVYLTPNMTYYPRVMKKPNDIIVNGSVAILIPKDSCVLTEKQRKYFSTDEYRKFYKVARNYQTRSLNVDNNSVFFFGVLKEG